MQIPEFEWDKTQKPKVHKLMEDLPPKQSLNEAYGMPCMFQSESYILHPMAVNDATTEESNVEENGIFVFSSDPLDVANTVAYFQKFGEIDLCSSSTMSDLTIKFRCASSAQRALENPCFLLNHRPIGVLKQQKPIKQQVQLEDLPTIQKGNVFMDSW